LGHERAEGLSVRNLRVSYGAAQAVSDVSFDVEAGSVLALLGANGAGKSSIARACAGLVPASSGTVTFGATEITKWSADRIRRAGLVYLPEIRGIFPNLTVAENLKLGLRLLPKPASALDSAYEMFPQLSSRREQRAGSLSGGEQQMLALTRALLGEARVVIVDEPSLGLAPMVVDQVFESLQLAKSLGVAMVLIEQFADRALALSESCVILRRGAVSWAGPASGAGAVLSEHYFGSGQEEEPGVEQSG
jgi:branched-chain amino acid transport system ATP-binding protein